MKRPSARFHGRGHRRDEPEAPETTDKTAERERIRQRVLELVAARGEVYSAEVARELGLRCATAKDWLLRLERGGLLCGERRPVSHSGLGRRYFRVAAVAA